MKTEENKPDLSKIVVGSRVTFVATKEQATNLDLGFDASVYPKHIISIEPPAFDWSSVRPGMAFITKEGAEVAYIGPDPYTDTLKCCMDKEGKTSFYHKKDLTPAPEE